MSKHVLDTYFQYLTSESITVHSRSETQQLCEELKSTFYTVHNGDISYLPRAYNLHNRHRMYLPINLRYTYNNPDMAENIIQGEPSYLQQMLDGELGEIIIAIPDIKDHLLKGMTYLLIGSDSINTISLYETLIGDKHDER